MNVNAYFLFQTALALFAHFFISATLTHFSFLIGQWAVLLSSIYTGRKLTIFGFIWVNLKVPPNPPSKHWALFTLNMVMPEMADPNMVCRGQQGFKL